MNRRCAAALIASAVLAFPLAAHAKNGGQQPAQAQVEGVITAINTAATPPTVTISGVTVNVTAATKIEINEAHATLADLDLGAAAEAKYDPATFVASKIEQSGAGAGEAEGKATGVVVAVDAAAGTLSIDTNGDTVADVTLTVNAATELKIGPAELGAADLDLLVGLTVTAEFDATTLVASEVKATSSPASSFTGTVTAIDNVNGTVTIQPASGPAVTVIITADTEIEVKGGLKVGAQVVATGVVSASGDQIALDIRSPKAAKQKGHKQKGKGGHGGGHDDPQPHH